MMNDGDYDTLIIGAGPAGLQLGYFFQKSGGRYIILEEAEEAGSFFKSFPRHRRLISINKVHTGRKDADVQFRWDWNSLINDERLLFKNHSEEYFPQADSLVEYLKHFASANALNVWYQQRVVHISRQRDRFVVATPSSTFTAERVIVATGASEAYVPPIEGIQHAINYANFDTDPRRYKDRKVLIIGKGNSGFETADSLIPFAAQIHIVGRHSIKHAWHTHHVGHLRAVNNSLIDTDALKAQNATIWGEVQSIERYRGQFRVRISHIDSAGRVFTHIYDDIICCTGFKMAAAIFHDNCKPDLVIDDRFPALTAEWESTNVPNLFFAGSLTQSLDFKKSSSAFIHGFRYNAQALFRILSLRGGMPWPSISLERSAETLTNALVERINTTTSLWHQFNFFADVIMVSSESARYYRDVPFDYAMTSPPFAFERCLLLTFTHDKPRNVELHHHFSKEPALHPCVRLVEHQQIVSEHHMLEDLEAEWFEDSLYINPLQQYLEKALAGCSAFIAA
ncbi:MAG TPA: NAD(P)-binding domain-containing protein [Terrimicrobiaceae bacterium]